VYDIDIHQLNQYHLESNLKFLDEISFKKACVFFFLCFE
jgi:hypothetical protein